MGNMAWELFLSASNSENIQENGVNQKLSKEMFPDSLGFFLRVKYSAQVYGDYNQLSIFTLKQKYPSFGVAKRNGFMKILDLENCLFMDF